MCVRACACGCRLTYRPAINERAQDSKFHTPRSISVLKHPTRAPSAHQYLQAQHQPSSGRGDQTALHSPQYQPHRVVSATNSSRNTTIRTTTLHLVGLHAAATTAARLLTLSKNPACRIQNCSRPYCCAVSAAPLPALPVNGTYVLYPRIVMTPSSRSFCHKLDDSRRVHPDDSNATSI